MDADAYVAVLEAPDLQTGEVEREYLVALQLPEVHTTTVGEQGPPGRQGEPGPAGGSVLQRPAGHVVSALRMVYELNGQVFYLDYRDANTIYLLLGLTLSGAQAGELLNIQRAGVVEDSSWAWAPGALFLGPDGSITQNPPVDGFCVLLGSAVSATRIILDINRPIYLG